MIDTKYDAIENSEKSKRILGMNCFNGRFTVYDGGQYIWSKISPITRLNKEDAIEDAKKMNADIEEDYKQLVLNGGWKGLECK